MKITLLALTSLLLAGPAYSGELSFSKILTVNHFGSPSDNDGFRTQGFFVENKTNNRETYLIGFLKNSEDRPTPSIGYSRLMRKYNKLSVSGDLYLLGNYKKLSRSVAIIPMLGLKYDWYRNVSLNLGLTPVVKSSDPYLLSMSRLSFKF